MKQTTIRFNEQGKESPYVSKLTGPIVLEGKKVVVEAGEIVVKR
ncbi:hypothetical protein P4641_08620 [Halalkalibacterium halodurans]|nr:hypothetical protein [Halalkalibacterium halodurans]